MQLGAGTGTGFPTTIDTRTTEVNSPSAGKTKARAEVMNDVLSAVIAIETELGANAGNVKKMTLRTSEPSAVPSTIIMYAWTDTITGAQSIRVKYPDGTISELDTHTP